MRVPEPIRVALICLFGVLTLVAVHASSPSDSWALAPVVIRAVLLLAFFGRNKGRVAG